MNVLKKWLAVVITVGLVFLGFSFYKFNYLTLKGDPFFFYLSLGMFTAGFILASIIAFKHLAMQKLQQGN